MSRVLVTGGHGMLAQDVVPRAERAGHGVLAPARDALDITDPAAVDEAVSGADVVVNTAGWTAVDDAETHEAEAFAANATGPANLARAARRHGALLIQLSTDYVFDGLSDDPYPVGAPISPRSAYGRTKAAGEWAVRADCPSLYLLRTAWLYGAGGPSFVTTMAQLAQERDTVSVVDDQTGSPTWTGDLADRIVTLMDGTAPFGTYHATNTGSTTWFGFARAIFAALGHDPSRVVPVTSEQFRAAARRPRFSVLAQDAWRGTGLEPMRDWRAALDDALPEMFGDGVVGDCALATGRGR